MQAQQSLLYQAQQGLPNRPTSYKVARKANYQVNFQDNRISTEGIK